MIGRRRKYARIGIGRVHRPGHGRLITKPRESAALRIAAVDVVSACGRNDVPVQTNFRCAQSRRRTERRRIRRSASCDGRGRDRCGERNKRTAHGKKRAEHDDPGRRPQCQCSCGRHNFEIVIALRLNASLYIYVIDALEHV